MIVLQEIFNLLATGEFSNISLSRDSTGSIDEKEYPKVVGHLNLGIIEIYKRFNFLQKELNLHLRTEISTYFLRTDKVAALNNLGTRAYIEQPSPDDTEGFLNIIEIKSVFNSSDDEVNLNDRFSIPYILQLSPDSLKITGFTENQILRIGYQAYPCKIIIKDDFSPEEYPVYIPETILEALLYYVAGRVYKPIGSNDSSVNADKSASYQQQYELACQKLEVYGLDPQHSDNENNFEKEGWA